MTNFNIYGSGTDGLPYLNGYANLLSFSSFVSSDATSYVFASTAGRMITVTGTDIVTNGSGRFVSGTITGLTISSFTDSSVVDFEFTDLNFDGTQLLGSNGTNVPGVAETWIALFDGEVTMKAFDQPGILLGMDGNVLDGGSFQGSDSTVRGEFGGVSYVSGAFNQVTDFAIVHGGDMDFRGYAPFVVGDVYYAQNDVRVIGGDDRIVITDFTRAEVGNSSGVNFSGDVDQVVNNATVVGGDDYIDVRDLESYNGEVRISGDVRLVSGGVVVGGDDDIRGSRSLDNIIAGDQIQNSNLNLFVGGDDTIRGGAGDDELYGDIGSETVTGSAGGNDIIHGGGGNDTMVGSGGRDKFFKGSGGATIYGGNGSDSFQPNSNGAHSFYGGSGEDTVNYSKATGRIDVDLFSSANNRGWAANDVLSSVENITGSQTQNNFIYGNFAGNKIIGGDKSDRVEGRGGGDEIKTAGGNDRIEADFGANTYNGGNGFDILSYDASSDGVRVDLSSDKAWGGDAAGDTIMNIEHLYGTSENDKFWGDNARNIFKGYDGNDSLYGRNGADALYGGADNDKLYGGFGGDIVNGGGGADKIFGGRGNDFLIGGNGEDVFHFDRGDDIDRIRDFQRNVDRIELDGFSNNYKPFQKASQVGNDVVFNFGNGDRLIVEDIQVSQLFGHIDIV